MASRCRTCPMSGSSRSAWSPARWPSRAPRCPPSAPYASPPVNAAMEAVAVQRHRGRIRADRQPQHRGSREPVSRPAAPARQADQPAPGAAPATPTARPTASSATASPEPVPAVCAPAIRDRYERRGDPVVEAALHVDQPADLAGTAGLSIMPAPKSASVGASAAPTRRASQMLMPPNRATQRSQADRQQQPGPEQPGVKARVSSRSCSPTREAPENSTSTRVTSASALTSSGAGVTLSTHSGPWVSSTPARTKMIGGQIEPRQPRRQGSPREYQRRHDRQIRLAHRLAAVTPHPPAAPARQQPDHKLERADEAFADPEARPDLQLTGTVRDRPGGSGRGSRRGRPGTRNLTAARTGTRARSYHAGPSEVRSVGESAQGCG